MPIGAAIGGAAVVGAGASVYSANKATKGATKAADQNAAIQQQQYNQTRSDLAPATATLAPATAALMQRLGLAPASQPASGNAPGQPGTSPAAPAMTTQQTQSILSQRPDVANSQWLNSIDPTVIGDQTGDGKVTSDDRAAYWYNNYGQGEGMQLPQGATPATSPSQPDTSQENGGLGPRDPNARPDFTGQQPTIGTGPSSATYTDPSQFTASPGYQFRLNEGIRNLNAGYGAKGLLKSGSAMEGINDYAAGQASSEYGNWFNQQMAKLGADQGQFNNDRTTQLAQYNQNRNVFDNNYNTDTSRYDTNFNSDRGYNTSRYDTVTGNLFQLAGMGQNAAAGTAAAGQNYANGMAANNNNLASVQGNAAIAGANGINGAINGATQAYGAYSNPFSVVGGYGAQGTMASASPATQNAFAGLY